MPACFSHGVFVNVFASWNVEGLILKEGTKGNEKRKKQIKKGERRGKEKKGGKGGKRPAAWLEGYIFIFKAFSTPHPSRLPQPSGGCGSGWVGT